MAFKLIILSMPEDLNSKYRQLETVVGEMREEKLKVGFEVGPSDQKSNAAPLEPRP